MKNNNQLYKIIIIVLYFSNIAYSQNLVEFNTGHICHLTEKATIQILLSDELTQSYGYELPYLVEWENIDNGEFDEFYTTDLDFEIPGLSAGSCEVKINMTDTCAIEFQTQISNYDCILIPEYIFL